MPPSTILPRLIHTCRGGWKLLWRHCRVALRAFAASLAERRAHVDAALRAGAEHLVADPDHAAVDRTGDAVEHLHVELREHESLVHAGVPDVALGGRVDHVPDLEALDGLVLGHAPAAVAAADDGGMAVPVLGAPVVATLGRHPGSSWPPRASRRARGRGSQS